MRFHSKNFLVPVSYGTSSNGAVSTNYRFQPSFFKGPGGPLAEKTATAAVLKGAVTELQTNLETNYSALSDAANLLGNQNLTLANTAQQPVEVPQEQNNLLLYGLLAALVLMFLVFSK